MTNGSMSIRRLPQLVPSVAGSALLLFACAGCEAIPTLHVRVHAQDAATAASFERLAGDMDPRSLTGRPIPGALVFVFPGERGVDRGSDEPPQVPAFRITSTARSHGNVWPVVMEADEFGMVRYSELRHVLFGCRPVSRSVVIQAEGFEEQTFNVQINASEYLLIAPMRAR